MNNKEIITIVVISDAHYFILLAALIKSIEANLDKNCIIDLWVIEDGINSDDKIKLKKSINSTITNLHWKEKRDIIPKGIVLPRDKTSFPTNIYYRFFITNFISPTVKKVIYLDVDMIVNVDILKLWQIDISDYVVGAVVDNNVKTFDNEWGGIKNYKDFNLPAKAKYFNSGLLLINIEKWKENDITKEAVKCIRENIKYADYPDQYALNILLYNKWLEIDPLWNIFASNDVENPYIIHFTGRKPIYKSYTNIMKYKKIFYNYINLTEWRGTPEINEISRYFKKIKNVLNKINFKKYLFLDIDNS